MKTNITIICPQLVTLEKDRLGSGIPYMPITAAYMAAILEDDYSLTVIDAFGEDPFNAWIEEKYIIQGIPFDKLTGMIPENSRYCILYVSTIMSNYVLHRIIEQVKKAFPQMKIIMIENSQSVIGCSLSYICRDYFASGADFIVLGECEKKVPALLESLEKDNGGSIASISGLIYRQKNGKIIVTEDSGIINDLDSLPFPAWNMLPIQNYWKLKYAHGPMQSDYLAVMTSRGCPFNCSFCVVPSMNHNKWRARSAKNVVDEFEYMQERYKVSEFHIEDLNPTSNEKRIIDICRIIIKRGLKIKWKLASGSKIETIKTDTLDLLKKAGCDYISFSPESGSKRILKLMNKPFKHKYALEMTGKMNRLSIKSQACFVLGFPGEEKQDMDLTKKYIKQLARAGIDEIALFIMTPIPGTRTFDFFKGYSDYSELTFAPTWRKDYRQLVQYRDSVYRIFLLLKIIFHPIKVIKQLFNLLKKQFETKSEMNIFRLMRIKQILKNS